MKEPMGVLKKYKASLEAEGYKVLYIGLYGSQNYNVSDEKSDIDAKVIILPSIEDIVFRKITSKVKEFDEGSCDIKDLITYYNVVRKGNFSFIEPFYTNWYIGDEYIRNLFRQIPVNKKSLFGGMCEKQKAFTHEYPSKKEEFEKFGVDPKQYHHVVRLYDIILTLEPNKELFTPYLTYNGFNQTHMKEIKRGLCGKTKEELIDDIEKMVADAKVIISKQEPYQERDFSAEVGNYLKVKLKEGLLND